MRKRPIIFGAASIALIAAGAVFYSSASNPSLKERSSRRDFWGSSPVGDGSISGHEAQYGSLQEITNTADAIVLGRIESVGPGPVSGEGLGQVHGATAYLRVQEVIRGTLVDGPDQEVKLIVLLGSSAERLGELKRFVPSPPGIYFLRYLPNEPVSAWVTPEQKASLVGLYALVSGQGLLENRGGRAVAPLVHTEPSEGEGPPAFPADLHGKPFPEVLEMARAAASAGHP